MSATSVQQGREFRDCRASAGLSQDDVARRYNKDIRTIRRWERGETAITAMEMDDIRALAALARTGTR